MTTTTPEAEYRSLTAEARSLYDEAVSCGATHDDAMEAAETMGYTTLPAEPYNDEQDDYVGCECEQDWNCPMHGGTNSPTWLESRYSHEEEDRY